MTRPLPTGRGWAQRLRREREVDAAPVVACLAVHPPSLAATRLRLVQFFDALETGGLAPTLWTFLSDDDLPAWYGRTTWGRLGVIAKALVKIPRAVALVARADVVVVQRECVPFGPPALEWLASRLSTLVWDVDDFVWRAYTSPTAGRVTRLLRTSERKHASIARWAAEVWAGSEAIAEWAADRNAATTIVPTVVPMGERPGNVRDRVAVWVGSHSTTPFLEGLLPALVGVSGLRGVVVVGGRPLRDSSGVRVDERPWSEETEAEVCRSARVGLYPVDVSNPYAEGKCGLKAVLYMSHGLPCVVTPTRPNRAIVRDGVDGLYATTPDEWRTAVERLLTDDDLWERCSAAGFERAKSHFSSEVWGPILADRLRRLAVEGRGHDAMPPPAEDNIGLAR